MNNYGFPEAFEIIKNSQKILLVTHDRPDGDALSSVCAMAELLENLGKEYLGYCLDQPPAQFNFLPHFEKITWKKDKLEFDSIDLIIALDCSNMKRTNLVKEISSRSLNQRVIEFDHHPKIDDYSDLEIRIPSLSSTAEVVYHFLKYNKIKMNKNYANCILTGILTDTGNFLFPSTSDTTIKIASEMLVYGARFPKITESAYKNKSLSAIKLWGKAMNNLKVNKKYNIAYSLLTYEDIKESGASEEELEGISNFLSNMKDVSMLIFLREDENGRIRGNIRTAQPHINVTPLAKLLGGGGHAKASGFTIQGRIEKTDKGYKII